MSVVLDRSFVHRLPSMRFVLFGVLVIFEAVVENAVRNHQIMVAAVAVHFKGFLRCIEWKAIADEGFA